MLLHSESDCLRQPRRISALRIVFPTWMRSHGLAVRPLLPMGLYGMRKYGTLRNRELHQERCVRSLRRLIRIALTGEHQWTLHASRLGPVAGLPDNRVAEPWVCSPPRHGACLARCRRPAGRRNGPSTRSGASRSMMCAARAIGSLSPARMSVSALARNNSAVQEQQKHRLRVLWDRVPHRCCAARRRTSAAMSAVIRTLRRASPASVSADQNRFAEVGVAILASPCAIRCAACARVLIPATAHLGVEGLREFAGCGSHATLWANTDWRTHVGSAHGAWETSVWSLH